MKQHLTTEQLIDYVHRALTDAQRESMNRHLNECPRCRTRLDAERQRQRRIHHELKSALRDKRPSSHASFAAIQPKLNRSRRLANVRFHALQLLAGLAAIAIVVGLGTAVLTLLQDTRPPALTPTAPTPSPAITAPPLETTLDFVLQPRPALSSAQTDTAEWPARLLHPGDVVWHNGRFHFFFNGSDGWPAEIGIGYATSPDGRRWQPAATGPVFTGEGVAYTDFTILASSVLVEDDGTWVLYFHTINRDNSDLPGVIGRATAPAPTGPWTADPEPVFTPGPETAWDGKNVSHPSVIRTEEGYVMYYTGSDRDERHSTPMIGRAASRDGVTWTRYDDPATSGPLYAAGDPVFTLNPERELIVANGYHPDVVKTEEGWLIAYHIYDPVRSRDSIGFAASDDGVTWTPLKNKTTFSSAHPEWRQLYHAALIHHEGTTYLYFDAQRDAKFKTDIYLAIYE